MPIFIIVENEHMLCYGEIHGFQLSKRQKLSYLMDPESSNKVNRDVGMILLDGFQHIFVSPDGQDCLQTH